MRVSNLYGAAFNNDSHSLFKLKLNRADYRIAYRIYDFKGDYYWYPSIYDTRILATLSMSDHRSECVVLIKQGEVLAEFKGIIEAEEYAKALLELEGK